MNREQRDVAVDLLTEAKKLVDQAIEMLDKYTKISNDHNTEVRLTEHLRGISSSCYPHEVSLEDLIERVSNGDEDGTSEGVSFFLDDDDEDLCEHGFASSCPEGCN